MLPDHPLGKGDVAHGIVGSFHHFFVLSCLSTGIAFLPQLVVWPFSFSASACHRQGGVGAGEQGYLLGHPREAVAEHRCSSASQESR